MVVSRVILMKEGSNPIEARQGVKLEETPNGVFFQYGRTRTLIPWHRIYEIEYR